MRGSRKDNELQKSGERARFRCESESGNEFERKGVSRCFIISSDKHSSYAVCDGVSVFECLCVYVGVTSPAVNSPSGQNPFILQYLAFIQVSAPALSLFPPIHLHGLGHDHVDDDEERVTENPLKPPAEHVPAFTAVCLAIWMFAGGSLLTSN